MKNLQARAAVYSQFGGVDVLEVVNVPTPVAGPGEVVVEVLAAGINHIEAYVRMGQYNEEELHVEFPQRQGSDFAGLVVQVGEGVTGFVRGSEVIGHAAMYSHANLISVPAGNLVLKPRALAWEIAGGLFLAGFAAEEAVRTVHVSRGETIVTSAAAGGVGSIVAQLAMLRGATVIGTCGERNFDYLRQLGVRPVVYGPGLSERIRELAPTGVDAYIDNFGKDDREVADALGVAPARFWSSAQRREVELRALRPTPDDAAEQTRTLEELARLAADRSVDILTSGFYPFERIRDAFDDLEKRHARGKIVLGMRPVDNSFHGITHKKMRDVQERGN